MGTVFLGSAIAPQLTLVSYQDTFKCFSYNDIQNKAQELDKVGKCIAAAILIQRSLQNTRRPSCNVS